MLEYVEGRSLGELASRGEGLSIPVLLRIAATVAGALEHAHRRDVIHKDLKPANIIVSPAGVPVLCDFSPSELVTGNKELDSRGLVGTPGYISPEQARGEEATPLADVWGLGATVFDLVAGRPPYAGDETHELVALAASEEPVDLSPLEGRAPECVISVVERCLRKDPAARYKSADGLRRAIEAAIDFIEISGKATIAVPSPRKGQTLLLHVERRDADLKGKFREYEILAYVGGGSYGEVYRARERLSGRDVALKVLRREWVSDQAAVARFRREASLLTRVSHPNVVRIYNFGRYGASFFIAMDFLKGPTLDDIVEGRERMDFGEAVGLTRQVLSGLSAMHDAGVFHRDLKPTNVMLVDEKAVLCDFGMATALDAGKLTTTGLVLGSPSYMSPEQALGEPVTSASDVYSAGVVLYEMLSGRLPHEERTTREILRSIVKEPPVPVGEWRDGVPRALAGALERMLAKEPDERPTAAEAMELLAAGVG
jgi:serine/threonine protein kinase